MLIKEQYPKEKTVVVRYRLPQRSQDQWYSRVFLPNEELLKFRVLLVTEFTRDFAVLSRIHPFNLSTRKVFEFIIRNEFERQIGQMESLLDTKGRIWRLVLDAATSTNQRAHDNELWVVWEDSKQADEFSELPPEKEEPVSGMRFYEYTEKAHTLLNEVVAGYARLAFKEKKKEHQDEDFLDQLQTNQELAMNLLRKSQTFSSLDQMSEVIAQYTPIVKALYDHPSTSQMTAS